MSAFGNWGQGAQNALRAQVEHLRDDRRKPESTSVFGEVSLIQLVMAILGAKVLRYRPLGINEHLAQASI